MSGSLAASGGLIASSSAPDLSAYIQGESDLSGTGLRKEWELAADVPSRNRRLQQHRFARSHGSETALLPAWARGNKRIAPQSKAVGAFVLTRGPLCAELGSQGKGGVTSGLASEDMLRRARVLFAELDVGRQGAIDLDYLEESVERLHTKAPVLRMTRVLFERYVKEFLPPGCERVNLEQFLAFHKHVWEMQPLAVRHAHGGSNGIVELHVVEAMCRKAFTRYAKLDGPADYLSKEELFSALTDLGLHLDRSRDSIDTFYEREFNTIDTSHPGSLSFHDFVRFKNQFITWSELFEAKRMVPRTLLKSASMPMGPCQRSWLARVS